MIWSQLRKQVRALICDELRDRVDIHRAVYRKSWESMYDRAWITIDGVEVFELSHAAWSKAWRAAENTARQQQPDADWAARSQLVSTALAGSGVKPSSALGASLHRYLEAPIAESLNSPDPLIRGLAMLDRRTGRRTLARMMPADEHPLVRTFHELRTGSVKPNG